MNQNPLSRQSQAEWPRSLDEAVGCLAAALTRVEQGKLAAMPATTLEMLNASTLGATTRKVCGLWHGNPELLAACSAYNPEDASLVIIQAVWERLRGAG